MSSGERPMGCWSVVAFDPDQGYSRGADLYYQCLTCQWLLPTSAADNGGCACGNLFIDADAHRFIVEDHRRVRLLRLSEPAKA